MKNFYWAAIETEDQRLVAWHECGHKAAAEHYGIEAPVVIRRVGDPSEANMSWVGSTLHPIGCWTKYQDSVVAWCGPLVERLSDFPLDEWPDEIESCGEALVAEIWGDFVDGSWDGQNDKKMIGSEKFGMRTLPAAKKIVMANRKAIAANVCRLLAGVRNGESWIDCPNRNYQCQRGGSNRYIDV